MTEPSTIGRDLTVSKVVDAALSPGTWLLGTVHGHRFEAKSYAEHALNLNWELGERRISNLFIQRIEDNRRFSVWARGLVPPPKHPLGEAEERPAGRVSG